MEIWSITDGSTGSTFPSAALHFPAKSTQCMSNGYQMLMLTNFSFFCNETLQLRVSVGFKWLPFPRSGLLLSLEPTIQIK